MFTCNTCGAKKEYKPWHAKKFNQETYCCQQCHYARGEKLRTVNTCVNCGLVKIILPAQRRQMKFKDDQYRCITCSRSHNASQQTFEQRSNRMKNAHARNPETAKRVGKMRRSYRTTPSEVWHEKQMNTIRSDPARYQRYCEKRKQISLQMHASMTNDEKEQHYQKVFANKKGISKAEVEFFEQLQQHNIHFERNKCISGFFPDGVDTIKKLIIEFYGDTYHCNPKKFNEPTQYCSWISRTVQQQWDRDRKRLAVFYKCGYNVLIVWESEWYSDPTIIIERIQNALCINRTS